jgi:hypothetical protein
MVQVAAAVQAYSLAILAAKRPGRQGKKNLLPQDILKRKTVILIVPDFGLRGRDGVLRTIKIGANRAKKEVEFTRNGVFYRVNAPGTRDFEISLVACTNANIGDDIPGTAMFFKQVSASGGMQIAVLVDIRTVIDGPIRER